MADSPWLALALAPILVETLVLFVRPQWLAPLAFLGLREHRFTLRAPRRDPDARAGYRDLARTEAPIPALPARTELSDSVLFAAGPRLALRRAYGLGRRQIWLVGIAIERAGDEIVLRAKQAFVPVTLPIFVIAIAIDLWARSGDTLFVALMPLVFVAVLGVQHLFTRGSRDEQLEEAFSFVESELRRELEEPRRRAA